MKKNLKGFWQLFFSQVFAGLTEEELAFARELFENVNGRKPEEGESVIPTGIKKVGAMLGDFVEVGCNSVLNPGTVIGRNSNIYPLSRVRGFVPENSIFKSSENIVPKKD